MEIGKVLNFTLSVTPYEKNEEFSKKLSPFITVNSFLFYVFLFFIVEFVLVNILKLFISQHSKRSTEISKVKGVSILSVFKHLIKCKLDLQHTIRSLVNTYGLSWKISLFGVKEIVFLHDPAMLHKLYTSWEPGHLNKPNWLYSKILVGPFQNGLTSSRVNIWKPHRTAVCKGFSYNSLRNQVELFNEYGKELVCRLNEPFYSKGKLSSNFHSGSLSRIVHETAFNIISHIATGKKDILSLPENKIFHDNFYKFKKLVSYRVYHPWLIPNILWSLHPKGRELDKAIKTTEDIVHKICRIAKEESLKTKDMNRDKGSSVPSLVDEMIKGRLSDEEIYHEIYTFVTAGHETVSMTVNLTLFHLAANAEYQKNCQEEVDHLFFEMNALNQSEVSLEALNELKYLDRCIKEELRLYPTTPIVGRQIDSPIIFDDNTTVCAGTTTLTSLWLLHRNQDNFPDPEKFDPDRFKADKFKQRGLCEYIPFTTGARNCIGWKSGTLEVKVLLAYIIHNFELYTEITVENLRDAFEECIWPPPEPLLCLKRRRSISS